MSKTNKLIILCCVASVLFGLLTYYVSNTNNQTAEETPQASTTPTEDPAIRAQALQQLEALEQNLEASQSDFNNIKKKLGVQ